MLDVEFIDLFFKQLPLIFTVLGTVCAYFLYSLNLDSYFNIKTSRAFKVLYNFLSRKWYFDRLYNQMITQKVLFASYEFSYKDLDRGIIETAGPSGVINSIKLFNGSLKQIQSGIIFNYLFLFLFFIIFFIFCIIILASANLSALFFFFSFLLIYTFF
jgi:NADH-quinone oxidoreductase subunit L